MYTYYICFERGNCAKCDACVIFNTPSVFNEDKADSPRGGTGLGNRLPRGMLTLTPLLRSLRVKRLVRVGLFAGSLFSPLVHPRPAACDGGGG